MTKVESSNEGVLYNLVPSEEGDDATWIVECIAPPYDKIRYKYNWVSIDPDTDTLSFDYEVLSNPNNEKIDSFFENAIGDITLDIIVNEMGNRKRKDS